ncbi:PXA domain-containing protein [Zychaea mexicana]|uniref:PXA domain-containing protein n=1 Tax=Zychaea mexicana TaxID=64656 RepID=UPI0022FE0247|nr:PXA domain-containing protein [Zychaea mexicana]KAI9494703.1 PXA domain-containing protein [Zychaea mexicana]
MEVLADWFNLLRLSSTYDLDDSLRALVGKTLSCAFVVVYSLVLIVDGYYFPFFLTLGFALGALFFGSNANYTFPHHSVQLREHYTENAEAKPLATGEDGILHLFYPPLTNIVEQLIHYFSRDFVLSWWDPLNSTHNPEFERVIRTRLNGSVHRVEKILLKQERNDLVMATLYGIANVLIIHMRECRNFECSGLSLNGYIDDNQHSPFAQLMSTTEQHHQMRSLSSTILKRVLPNTDADSAVVMSMLRELLASHLFGNILATMSDPDFINSYIVGYLSATDEPGNADAHDDSEGIRNVVERAAESLMADGGFGDASQGNNNTSTVTSGTQQAASPEVYLPPQSIPPTSPLPPPPPPRKSATVPPDLLLPSSSPPPSFKGDSDAVSESATSSLASLPPIPETHHNNNSTRSSPSAASSKKKISVPKVVEDASQQSPMIYAPGTVNFSVMDISSTPESDKNKLMFIVQIERPAMEDHTGSEGGGYVITRTYADFEVFHAIISARHARRVARTNLRLPLDPIRSWLKLGTNTSTPSAIINDTDSICRSLERYLHLVVQDNEMGRDQIIYAFLRKERRRNIADHNDDDDDSGEGQQQEMEVSFADEYMDEVSAYAALSSAIPAHNGYTPLSGPSSASSSAASSVGKAMSMLARAPSLAVKSVSRTSTTDDELVGSPSLEPSRRWFGRKSAREGSISSVRSNNSSSGKEEADGEISTTFHHHQQQQQSQQNHQHVPSPPSTQATTCSEDEGDDDEVITNVVVEEPESVAAAVDIEESARRTAVDDAGARVSDNKPLSPLDIELLIETTFALVVEVFDLTTANNKAWMRRTLLNVLREVVRRSYTEIIAQHYSSYMNNYMSPDALVHLCETIQHKFWPDGVYNTSTSERTEEQKAATRQQARELLMSSAVPAGVRQLIGDQNCNVAMDRLWARLQDQALNRVLMLQILERLMRPVFG